MTPRKRWPNEAEWAREDAIAILEKVVGSLIEVVDKDLTQIEIMKRLAKAVNALRQVQQRLRDVG